MRYVFVLLVGLTAWTSPALADDDSDWPNCNGADGDSAIAACTRILRRGEAAQSDLAIAYNNLGLAYENRGEPDRAIAALDEAIALDPQLASAYNNRGFAYNNKGQYDRAIGDLDQAIGLNPQLAEATAPAASGTSGIRVAKIQESRTMAIIARASEPSSTNNPANILKAVASMLMSNPLP